MKKYAPFLPDGLHPFPKPNPFPAEQDRLMVKAPRLCWETETSQERREGTYAFPFSTNPFLLQAASLCTLTLFFRSLESPRLWTKDGQGRTAPDKLFSIGMKGWLMAGKVKLKIRMTLISQFTPRNTHWYRLKLAAFATKAFLKIMVYPLKYGMVTNGCNPSTWESQAQGFEWNSSPGWAI